MIMACRLCRAKKAEMSDMVSLKSVDESKLQTWASQNIGNRINVDDNPLVCWTCVHGARKLARCFGSDGQDWWTGLEDPNGTPEDDSCSEDDDWDEEVEVEGDEVQPVVKPCCVRLRRLTGEEIASCPLKLSSTSVENEDCGILENLEPKSTPLTFECKICRYNSVFFYHLRFVSVQICGKCLFINFY